MLFSRETQRPPFTEFNTWLLRLRGIAYLHSLKLTSTSSLKIGRVPRENLFSNHQFSGAFAVIFREGNLNKFMSTPFFVEEVQEQSEQSQKLPVKQLDT